MFNYRAYNINMQAFINLISKKVQKNSLPYLLTWKRLSLRDASRNDNLYYVKSV